MVSASNHWIKAGQFFAGGGTAPLSDQIIQISGDKIAAILPASTAAPDLQLTYFDVVAPGFIDLQINGAGGVLFNDQPDLDAINTIVAAARKGGTCHLLPTFITAEGRTYKQALQSVGKAQGLPEVLGLHLEGPFLSPAKPGIHDPAFIRKMDAQDLACLTGFEGRLLVTCAPEEMRLADISALSRAGVIVFAGHSMADSKVMSAAATAGICGVTHLFNACSQIEARAPGIVGTALSDRRLFAGIIADTHHVHEANLKLASAQMEGRLCLVSDTMPSFGSDLTSFKLQGKEITLQDGRLLSRDRQLAGAHLGLDEAVRNMIACTGISAEKALDMASGIPARILGLEAFYGQIEVGRFASLTCMDNSFTTEAVYVHGNAYQP